MKAFLQFRNRSADYARNRMKLLLVSERIDCSPQMMKLLKDDMIRTVKKYVSIDEDGVMRIFRYIRKGNKIQND